MKKLFLLSTPTAFGAALTAFGFARTEARIRPNTTLGIIQVGGLTKADAAAKLSEWWQTQRSRPISVTIPNSSRKPLVCKLDSLGIVPDVGASTGQLQVSDMADSAKLPTGPAAESQHYLIRFKRVGELSSSIRLYVDKSDAKYQPARVFYQDGAFTRKPERGGVAPDDAELTARAIKLATTGDSRLELPVKDAKRVSEAQLDQITDVISSFTTRFPARKKDRNTNIRIASGKINGWVLMPGDTFSFNNVVGKRTIEDGFRTAPVYKNGKHDMGVGGGICQVSSTLYNAALFGDLGIVQRHNHSMPVPYLPVGRDATVDYGSLDLAFKNTLSTPVAISSEYKTGSLTFRILGKKDPSITVKIESSDSKSWDAGTKTLQNPALPTGTKKVLDKGSRGHSIKTYRVVYKDGVEVSKEPLGRSYYKGGTRVVSVGTKPVQPALVPPPGTAVPPPAATQPVSTPPIPHRGG